MHILFLISIVCFSALIYAAAGIARHIQSGNKAASPKHN